MQIHRNNLTNKDELYENNVRILINFWNIFKKVKYAVPTFGLFYCLYSNLNLIGFLFATTIVQRWSSDTNMFIERYIVFIYKNQIYIVYKFKYRILYLTRKNSKTLYLYLRNCYLLWNTLFRETGTHLLSDKGCVVLIFHHIWFCISLLMSVNYYLVSRSSQI